MAPTMALEMDLMKKSEIFVVMAPVAIPVTDQNYELAMAIATTIANLLSTGWT